MGDFLFTGRAWSEHLHFEVSFDSEKPVFRFPGSR